MTTTSATANSSKRKKRQSSTEAGVISGKTERKDGHPVRATGKISNLEDRRVSSVSIESANRATSAPRNLYTGDFGPLFTNSDARQQSLRQSDQHLPIWNTQPYPQQQQQQQQPYGQHILQPYFNTSPPPVFPMTPQSHAVSEPPASPSQQIQAYISSLPNDPPLPVSSLTHTFSRGEDSNPITHTSYQPNAPQNITIKSLESSGFPDLPPAYSANPTVNPNPYHLNAPLPRDEFYLTLNYSTLFNATMEIAKILQVSEHAMVDEDSISPFNRPDPVSLPEGTGDLDPTRRQLEIMHHPYIDTLPFKGFRDRILEYVKKGEETGDYLDETKLCHGMYESWGVWGQIPWEARSWEIGETFAR